MEGVFLVVLTLSLHGFSALAPFLNTPFLVSLLLTNFQALLAFLIFIACLVRRSPQIAFILSSSLIYFFSVREKKRINAALPAGVTDKDVQLFTRSQDKAKAFLAEENKGLEEEGSPKGSGLPPTPRTPLSAGLPGRALASPGAPATRTPQMIQFGRFDITTWYSSPYPQEFAR